ncbi:MAG: DUF2240 family protein [Candidatus Thermoplasmatota archaeon]|nr:DUF2240 family protein [Candidatus Thermoplasmatota archaeon]
MSALEQTIAYIFKRKGKQEMSVKDFIYSLSIDLHWFSPDECKKLLNICIKSNLIIEENDTIKPNFAIENISIPLEFKPTKEILEYKKDLFIELVRELESVTKLDKKAIVAEINKLQSELNIEIDVAALLLAKKHNIDISYYIKELENVIAERAQ